MSNKAFIILGTIICMILFAIVLCSCEDPNLTQAIKETPNATDSTPSLVPEAHAETQADIEPILKALTKALEGIAINNQISTLCIDEHGANLDCYEEIKSQYKLEWKEADLLDAIREFKNASISQ